MHISVLSPHGNFDPEDRAWNQHPDFGGSLVQTRELSLRLARRGHTVDLITRRFSDPAWPDFSAQTQLWPGYDRLRIVRLPCGPERFLGRDELWPHIAEWADNIAAFYETEGWPDVHSAHHADGGLAAALLREKNKTPFVYTGHGFAARLIEHLPPSGEDRPVPIPDAALARRLAAERTALARASMVVAATKGERADIGHARYEGVVDPSNDEKLRVITPGVNLDIFDPDESGETDKEVRRYVNEMIRRDLPMQRRHLPLVICTSRLDVTKNLPGLVRAWSENENLKGSANLAIAIRGHDNPLRAPEGVFTEEQERLLDRVRELIDERNLWPCVTTLEIDNQRELAAAYRYVADHYGVFVLTDYYSAFGLSAMEAMACGLPAVATQNGGPSEILDDFYGVLVNPHEPDDIAAGLLKLIKRKDLWERMREQGMLRARKFYTWDKAIEAYDAALTSAKDGGGAPDDDVSRPQWFTNSDQDDIPPLRHKN